MGTWLQMGELCVLLLVFNVQKLQISPSDEIQCSSQTVFLGFKNSLLRRHPGINSCCNFLHKYNSDYSSEGMSWNYSCFHAHSAFLSVLQVKWSTFCQHLAVNLLSYPTLYHSACGDPPHEPCLWGQQDAETGFLSLICLAWTSWWVKSLPRRKPRHLWSRLWSLEEELPLTFI